jgi:hypothetical protein
MKKILLLLAIFALSISAKAQTQEPYKQPTREVITGSTTYKYSFKIIDGQNHTYGYDIYRDQETSAYIHQPNIPGAQGNDGFKTKMDAQKTAKFVITKLAKGEIPPTVTTEDLKKMNVQSK